MVPQCENPGWYGSHSSRWPEQEAGCCYARNPTEQDYRLPNPTPRELLPPVTPYPKPSKTSQTMPPNGYQVFKYMNEPKGHSSSRPPHEIKEIFAFLGTKGRDRLLDLIATLLVLQFLRSWLEKEGMVAKSLLKMDDTFISRCFNVLIRNFYRSHSIIIGLFQTTV